MFCEQLRAACWSLIFFCFLVLTAPPFDSFIIIFSSYAFYVQKQNETKNTEREQLSNGRNDKRENRHGYILGIKVNNLYAAYNDNRYRVNCTAHNRGNL